jgi:Flp pilus assembly protein TadD
MLAHGPVKRQRQYLLLASLLSAGLLLLLVLILLGLGQTTAQNTPTPLAKLALDAQELADQGIAAQKRGDYALALNLLGQALQLAPNNHEILTLLHQNALAANRPDLAGAYAALLPAGPEKDQHQLAQAQQTGDSRLGAALAYAWLLQEPPPSSDLASQDRAWENLLNLALRDANWALAETILRAQYTRFNLPQTRFRLALLLLPSQPSEARTYLRQLADQPALAAQAEVLLALLGQAEPPTPNLLGLGLALLNLQAWPYAERTLGLAAKQTAEPLAVAMLAVARAEQGKFSAENAALLADALARAPNDALVNYAAGIYARRAGRPAEGLAALKLAQLLAPNNPAINAEIGLSYAADGFPDEALQWLKQAALLEQNSSDFLRLLALFYADNNLALLNDAIGPAEGYAVIEAAFAQRPDDTDLMAALGWAALRNGQLNKANDLLKQALTLAPTAARSQYYWAVYLEYVGDATAAKSAYQRLLETGNNPFRQQTERALLRLG